MFLCFCIFLWLYNRCFFFAVVNFFFSLPPFSLLLWVFLSYSSRTRSLLLQPIQWIQKSVWLDTFDFGFLWFTSASIALYLPIFSTFSTMECDCRELDFSCIRFLFDFSPFDFIPELHLLCAIPWNSLSGWTHNPSKCIERRRRKITSLVHHNCCRVHDWQGKNGSDSRNNFAKKKKSQWTQNCKILCVQSERGGGVSELAFEEFRFILFVVIIEKRSNKLHVNDFTLGRLHCVRYSLHRNLGIVMW